MQSAKRVIFNPAMNGNCFYDSVFFQLWSEITHGNQRYKHTALPILIDHYQRYFPHALPTQLRDADTDTIFQYLWQQTKHDPARFALLQRRMSWLIRQAAVDFIEQNPERYFGVYNNHHDAKAHREEGVWAEHSYVDATTQALGIPISVKHLLPRRVHQGDDGKNRTYEATSFTQKQVPVVPTSAKRPLILVLKSNHYYTVIHQHDKPLFTQTRNTRTPPINVTQRDNAASLSRGMNLNQAWLKQEGHLRQAARQHLEKFSTEQLVFLFRKVMLDPDYDNVYLNTQYEKYVSNEVKNYITSGELPQSEAQQLAVRESLIHMLTIQSVNISLGHDSKATKDFKAANYDPSKVPGEKLNSSAQLLASKVDSPVFKKVSCAQEQLNDSKEHKAVAPRMGL